MKLSLPLLALTCILQSHKAVKASTHKKNKTSKSKSKSCGTLYGTTGAGGGGSSNLFIINSTKGAYKLVGDIGFNGVVAMDIHPVTGVMYGIARDGFVITINTRTGAGTYVATLSCDPSCLGSGGLPDMSFDSNGDLFVWNENDDDLYKIHIVTGAMTKIGESGINSYRTGLAIDSSDMVYIRSAEAFYTVNANGEANKIDFGLGYLLNSLSNMLTFDNCDKLFAADRNAAKLFQISFQGNSVQFIGDTPPDLVAIAFSPSS